jgi:dimethyl sulfoxide reductase membrane subunit
MEESVVTFNVFHHVAWGTAISVYFWLVGASAGSFVVGSLGWVFGVKRFRPIALTASVTSISMLMLVPLLLIWDLGKPVRFIYLLIPGYWHATGPMAWGTVLICLYTLTMMIYIYFIIKNNTKLAKSIGILAVMLSLIPWYTGVVMELNPGRFLNHTALAPLLFLVGAFISGIGLLIVVLGIQNLFLSATRRTDSKLFIEMSQYMMYGLVFDLFLLFLEFMQSTYGSMNMVLGHEVVLMGVLKFPYLWLEIVIGLVVPIVMLISPLKRNVYAVTLAAFMVCVGVYGMRVWWVLGGQYLQTFY